MNSHLDQQLKKNIKKLAGCIEDIKLNDLTKLNKEKNQTETKSTLKKNDNEFNKRNSSAETKEESNCCDTCFVTSPLFFFLSILMIAISLLLFIYLINQIDQATHPDGVEAIQTDSMFFDYIVTDTFSIHNKVISTHSRNFDINFNSPYGVNFNNMSVKPNGTITASNCNFSEIYFQKIKIKGSTILPITPQNDEIIFDLPTVNMDKSLSAMELECSGFIIRNGKLFDSTGSELTWPSPGDSRYSFLSTSQYINQNDFNLNNKIRSQIFNIHTKSLLSDTQTLLDNEKVNSMTPVISDKKLYRKMTVKENFEDFEFHYNCSNIAASYNSFVCVSTEKNDSMIYFVQCLDSKCIKTATNIIDFTSYSKNTKVEKMLLFDDYLIAILLEDKNLYILNKESIKLDQIINVKYIDVIDDGMTRHLLYVQDNYLFKYQNQYILTFQMNDKNFGGNLISSQKFKSNLVLFTNFNQVQKKSNDNIIIFHNQGNISKFAIDKNGIIYAIDSLNCKLLICNIKSRKCEKMINIDIKSKFEIFSLNRGGFAAISIDNNRKISYHFLSNQNLDTPKVITTHSSEVADEIVLTLSKGRYPRIFSVKNGVIKIIQCTNSKCQPGFAN